MDDKAAILRRELEELRVQIAILERTIEEKPDYGLGEGDPAVAQWELDRAMLGQLKERATSIERLLSQTVEDTYGICKQCGRAIHPDRLTVLPGTRICIHCAKVGGRERAD